MRHRLVITYDITNDKLRNKVHKFLSDFGVNSQKSVFEMIVNDYEFREIIKFLDQEIPLDPNDSARVYELCKTCQRHISKIGEGLDLNPFNFEII